MRWLVYVCVISSIAALYVPNEAHAGYIYWTELGSGLVASDGAIRRANLDGTGKTTLVGGLITPSRVALDGPNGQMYWSEFGSSVIRSSSLTGSNPRTLIGGLLAPGNVTLDPVHGQIFWDVEVVGVGSGSIGRAVVACSTS